MRGLAPCDVLNEEELAQVGRDSYLMVPDQYFNLAQVQAPISTDLAEVDSEQEGLPAPVELG